jgi:serralysin
MAAGVHRYGKTGIAGIDGVLSGFGWNTHDLNYSFPNSRSNYEAHYSDPAANQVHSLTAAEKGAINRAQAQVESFTLLTFTNVTGTSTYPDLRFALSRAADPAFAYYPDNPSAFPEGGDAFFHGGSDFKNMKPGTYGFSTFLHETGHTLGLKHGHEAEGHFRALPRNLDSIEFSVMTYRAFIGGPIQGAFGNETYGFPQSYMMLDIAALQKVYGANYAFRGGDTVYRWSPTTGQEFINGVGQNAPGANRIFSTVWDGGGHDTYDFSRYNANLLIRLDPGSWSVTRTAQLAVLDEPGHHLAHGNIYNALLHNGNPASLIENAIGGSGSDRIVGNKVSNTLAGHAGRDTIAGHAGSDHLIGGSGRDILFGGGGGDIFVFAALGESRPGANRDSIKDFSSAQGDKIDLTAVETATGVAFHFIGASSFSGTPGELRHDHGIVKLDINGDRVADFEIHVAAALHGTDFIL